jgi:CcdB protein
VVLQSDILASLDTVLAAPVKVKAASSIMRRLNPDIDVEGTKYSVAVQEMAAVTP